MEQGQIQKPNRLPGLVLHSVNAVKTQSRFCFSPIISGTGVRLLPAVFLPDLRNPKSNP